MFDEFQQYLAKKVIKLHFLVIPAVVLVGLQIVGLLIIIAVGAIIIVFKILKPKAAKFSGEKVFSIFRAAHLYCCVFFFPDFRTQKLSFYIVNFHRCDPFIICVVPYRPYLEDGHI